MKSCLPFLISLQLVLTAIPQAGFTAEDPPARVYFLHAMKSRQEGNLLAAEGLLRRALELEPANTDFHFELGNLYIEGNNLPGARQELERVVMISPVHLAAHYNLGLVYREQGERAEARNEFRRVLELDPSHVKAQLQIGYTYQAEGFLQEAREAFRTAERMDAAHPEPEQALEDLAQFEEQLREKRNQEMSDSFRRNGRSFSPFFPGAVSEDPAAAAQSNGKQALAQAGALLLQQFLSQRQNAAGNPDAN